MSETKTVTLKQAMPTQNDWDRVYELINGLESICEYGKHPDYDPEDPEDVISAEDAIDWIRDKLANFSIWRVVAAGHCAIDNACDPSLSHLAFKPEIVEALQIAAARKEAAL